MAASYREIALYAAAAGFDQRAFLLLADAELQRADVERVDIHGAFPVIAVRAPWFGCPASRWPPPVKSNRLLTGVRGPACPAARAISPAESSEGPGAGVDALAGTVDIRRRGGKVIVEQPHRVVVDHAAVDAQIARYCSSPRRRTGTTSKCAGRPPLSCAAWCDANRPRAGRC